MTSQRWAHPLFSESIAYTVQNSKLTAPKNLNIYHQMTCQNSFCGQDTTGAAYSAPTCSSPRKAVLGKPTVHGQRDLWSLKPEGAVDGDSGDRISSEVESA